MAFTIRPLKVWVIIICVCLGQIVVPTRAQDVTSCPDSPPTRLENGIDGRVTPGSANRIRETPDTAGNILGSIPGGAAFNVLYDSVCGDGYLWWRVAYQGIVGWTVEGIGEDYFVEPYQDPEPISVYRADDETGFVDGGGVFFTLSAELVTDVTYQPVVGPMNPNVMSPQPNFRRFTLRNADDTPETNDWDTWGQLVIYPVAEYQMLGDYFVGKIAAIQQILNERPDLHAIEGPLTVLPACCSAQILHTQESYQSFENGSGYRFVTYYSQMSGELHLQNFSYQFIGLTDDGAYLINAEFRVDVPASAAPFFDQAAYLADEEPGSDYLKAYAAAWAANLNAVNPAGFSPDLRVLDEVFASLRVDPLTLP